MHQGFLPNIVASLGFVVVLLTTGMPLFEWQISKSATDFPSTYEVHIQPSPWTARVGDSLDHGYVSFGEVYVSKDGRECNPENVNFVVKRSRTDETLEQISLNVAKATPWLVIFNVTGIFLSIIYIWWFTIWYKRPIWGTVIFFIAVDGVFCLGLTQMMRNLLPSVGQLGTLDCYPYMVTFNAILSRVHYETLLLFFAGILMELGALYIMLRQIIKAMIEKKKGSELIENSS